jgi:Zn-dependent protease
MRLDQGGIRLFGLFGIDVFLHWSWLLVAVVEIGTRKNAYASQVWNVAEYLALFAIVLTHEFGHALACRSVGGKAERIILWPLGGVAFVEPPPRPGAVLWSIAAGPLVNVVLLPVVIAPAIALNLMGSKGDLSHFFVALSAIDLGLLIFNIMPFYPLDGGQILRALLWFFVGPVKSLRVACFIGLCGAGALLVGALFAGSTWLGILAFFGGMRAWRGFVAAGQAAPTPTR